MSELTVTWIDMVTRSTGILVSVLIASWVFRRRSAATRHAVCVAGMVSLLLLPVAATFIPSWRVLPHWMASQDVFRQTVSDTSAPAPLLDSESPTVADESRLPEGAEPHRPGAPPEQAGLEPVVDSGSRLDKQNHSDARDIERKTLAQEPAAEQARQTASVRQIDLATGLFIVLSVGSAVCGLRLVISLFWLCRISRAASIATGKIRNAVETLRQQMGITRTVQCQLIAGETVPMAWGVLRTELLLPESIVDWPDDRRNAVLLHELGHIARHDALWQFVTELAGIVFWFHPLYWIVRRHSAALRERSCDDIVLNHGVSATIYARALLDVISSTCQPRSAGPVAVAMSATSQLTDRIRTVMDPGRNRQPVQRFSAAIMGVLGALIVVPLAVLHAADQPLSISTETRSRDRIQPEKQADVDLTRLTNEQLLARFERAPFGSAILMTGGGFLSDLSVGEICRFATIWETQQQRTMEQDPTVREMIRRGDAILPDIHDRITHGQLSSMIENPLGTWGTADLYGAYAYVTGQIGNRETVTILIQLLRKRRTAWQDSSSASNEGVVIQLGGFSHNTTMVVTHALWQLTGRRHAFSADEWEQYLAMFGDEFVPARERSDRVPDPATVERHVRRLTGDVGKPSKNSVESREWLIAQGPVIVPRLLRALNHATEDHSVQIAWVIDELGGTHGLQPELRKRYFNHRLSQLSGIIPDGLCPVDDLARRRALEHLPFADFVEIALEAEERLPDELAVSMSDWLNSQANCSVQMKFGAVSLWQIDLNVPNSPWAGITPLEDPASEIEVAVPVLVDAIASPDQRRRKLSITFAEMLSLYSTSKPAILVDALRDCWTANLDREAGRIMAQFRTPAATQAVLDGLKSNDLTILTHAVGYLDEIRLKPTEHFDVFLKLLEYTRHPDQSLKRSAVVSLNQCAPKLLYTELERLSRDTDQRIREECVSVLNSHPTRRLVDILFDIANNPHEKQFLRQNAVSALGDPEYGDHINRMLLFLEDKELRGFACTAIADAAGSDALAVFYGVLQRGYDGDGNIYQYLERLTGAKPEQTVDAWQKWFAAHPEKIPAVKLKLDTPAGDRNN